MSELRARIALKAEAAMTDIAPMLRDGVGPEMQVYQWTYNIIRDALEAFAKEQQIKGMEAVRAEFERRKRHIRKSMLDIMFLKWIDAEIAKLKEGG